MKENFKNVIDIIRKTGIKTFNEPQKRALKAGVLEGKNIVVASPTASGKTIIAELAILNNFLNKKGKSIYIVPLKALASEKYAEFKEKYGPLGMKIALSVGDTDTTEEWLGSYDLIINTSEKLDSLIRHEAKWVDDISLIIADEIHLLDDPSRGPTLEITLTRLKERLSAQLVALSATISNAQELATWLDAVLVTSNYRPVKLYRGTYHAPELVLEDKNKIKRENIDSNLRPEVNLILDTIKKQKQGLVFVSSRRSAESAAEEIGFHIKHMLTKEELEKLLHLSKKIKNALARPTRQCERLADTVKKGAAFHHAGLVAKQRKLIEDNFRNGLLKIIAATPTLCLGVNLPAWRVVVRDLKRYSGGFGSEWLPVMEVHQMMGRAGRPQYDKEGQAILVTKDSDSIWEKYIKAEPEPISSKLAVEPMLRMHTLALITNEVCNSEKELYDFMGKTFFAHQYGDIDEIKAKLQKILQMLEDFSFIEMGNKESFISKDFVPAFELNKNKELRATKLGKRVAQLYLNPVSAHLIIQNLHKRTPLQYLIVLSGCIEMRPLLRVTNKEKEALEEELSRSNISTPKEWDIDYDEFLCKYKTSKMLETWINEKPEQFLLDNFAAAPGEVYTKTRNAEWLLYAGKELALLLNKNKEANDFNKLMLRMKYGIREELLSLVKLKGIGRVRARMLFKNGIRTVLDAKKADKNKLEQILGKKVAENLLGNTEQN